MEIWGGTFFLALEPMNEDFCLHYYEEFVSDGLGGEQLETRRSWLGSCYSSVGPITE